LPTARSAFGCCRRNLADNARTALLRCQADEEPAAEGGRANPSARLREIWMAEAALPSVPAFIESYQVNYEVVANVSTRIANVLRTFYDFPADHWTPLRTTNPIETCSQSCATMVRSKGHLSNRSALGMSSSLSKWGRKVTVVSMVTTSRQN
jgi:Transposase, Mutator family